jgi:hypothetical protein
MYYSLFLNACITSLYTIINYRVFSRSANDTNAQGSFGDLSSIFHVLNNPGEVITEVTQFESDANRVPVPTITLVRNVRSCS